MRFINLICALASIVLLAGCAGAPLPISSPSPAPSSTPTTLPTSTSAPAPTQTIAPARTPAIAPSPTRTATPVASTLTGWIAKLGGPDSARANLTAKLALPLKLAWEWKEENDKPVAVAVANRSVYLLTSRGKFCILDARTGAKKICQPIWQDVKGGASSTTGQIALSSDTALVSAMELYIKPGDRYGSARTRLSTFSLDGQPRWALPPMENQSGEAIVTGNGTAVFVSRTDIDKSWLTAFEIVGGAQRWLFPGDFAHGASNGGILYTDSGNISALRLSTGERVWEQSTNAKHVLYAQGRVFAAGDDTIAGLDATTGKLLWNTSFGVFPLTYDEVGIAAAHGHLYLEPAPGQTHQGYRTGVMALDAATGKEIWSMASPDRMATQIAATADSLVVAGQEWDGNVFAKKLWVLNPADGAELDRLVVSTDLLDEMNELAVADDQVYVLGRTLRGYGPSQPK